MNLFTAINRWLCFTVLLTLACVRVHAQDSLDYCDLPGCGATPDYFQGFQTTNPQTLNLPTTAGMTPENCTPHFSVYFEDQIQGSLGFYDATHGATRRATFCKVLEALENRFNIKNICTNATHGPSCTNRIRILVARSYDPNGVVPTTRVSGTFVNSSAWPLHAPANSNIITWLGQGAPLNNTSTGIQNGFVWSYVKTGVDPNPLGTSPNLNPIPYHAVVRINFDKYYYYSTSPANWTTEDIFYQNNWNAAANCNYDLYTVILHQMVHCMGWITGVRYYDQSVAGTSFSPLQQFSVLAGQYSGIDTAVYAGVLASDFNQLNNNKLITSGSLNTSVNLNAGRNFWLFNDGDPISLPVLGDQREQSSLARNQPYFSYISHLEDVKETYTARQRVSPGDYQQFAMGPYFMKGVERRMLTKGEERVMTTILGYTYNTGGTGYNPALINNNALYSKHMGSTVYSTAYNSWRNVGTNPYRDIAERVPIDVTLVNDQQSVLQINITTGYAQQAGVTHVVNINSLFDGDAGDGKYAYPSSVVNIRGCGIGGNNHAALVPVTDANNNIVAFKYTPREKFIGRAQFGFNLYDGKEKGGYVIYTIDVVRCTTSTCEESGVEYCDNGNLVLNGGFEEGSEVKLAGSAAIPHTAQSEDGQEGKMIGTHYADSHPHCWLMNNQQSVGRSGTIINDAFVECDVSNVHPNFGNRNNGFNTNAPTSGNSSNLVLAPSDGTTASHGGERFGRFTDRPLAEGLYSLCREIDPCKRYRLSFIAAKKGSGTQQVQLIMGLTHHTALPSTGIDKTPNVNIPSWVYWSNSGTTPPPVTISVNNIWQEYSYSNVSGLAFLYCNNQGLKADILYLRKKNVSTSQSDKVDLLIDNIKLEEMPAPVLTASYTLAGSCQVATLDVGGLPQGSLLNCSSNPVTYSWTPNDPLNNGLTGPTNIASPTCSLTNAPATYTVTVNTGCEILTAQVTVPPALPVTPVITSNNACIPLLTVSPYNPNLTYQWQQNAGGWTDITGETNATYQTVSLANYAQINNYRVVITNGTLCDKKVTIQVTILPPPVASITASFTNPCAPQLSATVGFCYEWQQQDPVTLAWSPVTSSSVNPFVPTASGKYRAKVWHCGYTQNCSSITNEISVVVGAPTGTVTVNTADPCFPVLNATPGLCYEWFLAGNSTVLATTASYTPTVSGTYTVVLRDCNGHPNCTTSVSTPAFVGVPDATVSLTGNPCSPTITVTPNVSGATYTYAFTGPGIPQTGTSNTYTPTVSGTYTITVTHNGGPLDCKLVLTQAVTIWTAPTVTIGLDPNQPYCDPTLVANISPAPGPGICYNINWETGTIASHTPIPGGATNATYNPTGTGGPASYYVSVIPCGAPTGCAKGEDDHALPNYGITPVITNSSTSCSVNLSVNPQAACFLYQWYDGANPIFGATNATYTNATPVAGAHSYTVQISVVDPNNGCGTYCGTGTSAPVSITINPLPVVSLTVQNNNSCAPVIVSSPVNGCFTYQWSQNGGAFTAGGSTYTVPSTAGTYTYQLKVTANNCASYCGTYTTNTVSATVTTQVSCGITYNNNVCAPMLTATVTPGPTTNYTYAWSGPGFTGPTNQVTASPTTNGTYQVIVTPTVGNCTPCTTSITLSGIMYGQPVCCLSPVPENPQSYPVCNNCNAAQLIAMYAPYGATGNTATITYSGPILVQGTLAVTQSFTFLNCPNVRFYSVGTTGAKVQVSPGVYFSVNGSNLSAACNRTWDGISTNNAGNMNNGAVVEFRNASVSDMQNGVQIYNNALINATSSRFFNNYEAMHFEGLPSNYAGVIKMNRFYTSMPNGLLQSYNGLFSAGMKGRWAIRVLNSAYLEVGGMTPPGGTSPGNRFDDFVTGIYILNTTDLSGNFFIRNNQFNTIRDIGSQVNNPNNAFTAEPGTAVFARNSVVGAPTAGKVTVEYDHGNSTMNFVNCTKAVTISGLNGDIFEAHVSGDVYGTNSTYAFRGYSFYQTTSHIYTVRSCRLFNVQYGIQLHDRPREAYIEANYVQSPLNYDHPYQPSNPPASVFYPVGITVNFLTNQNTWDHVRITDNTIDMRSWVARGIYMQFPDAETIVYHNTVSMTSNTVSAAVNNEPLQGIMLENGKLSEISTNTVTANPNIQTLTVSPRERFAGIGFQSSKQMIITCNSVSNTRYGFMVYDDCSPSRTENNTFKDHQYGMFFWYIGSSLGTLGDIGWQPSGGQPGWDLNNKFTGTYSIANGAFQKVYRFVSPCVLGGAPTIYTSNGTLTPAESQPSSCRYDVIPNQAPFYSLTCPGNQMMMMQSPVSDIVTAEDIAQDNITYPYFQQESSWKEATELYADLHEDVAARQQSPVLDSFYQSLATAVPEGIRLLNETVGSIDTAVMGDSTLFAQWLAAAQTANNMIAGGTTMDQNEHWINELYLEYLAFGIDSLDQDEIDSVDLLANSCPITGGTAVYKARMMNELYHPNTSYYDIDLCNNAGSQKGGKGIYDDDKAWLASQGVAKVRTFTVAPNPNKGDFTLEYELREDEHGEIVITDAYGRVTLSAKLDEQKTKKEINLEGVSSGIYFYVFLVNGKAEANGKVSVIK